MKRRGLSRMATSATKAFSFPSSHGICEMVLMWTCVMTSALRPEGMSDTSSCSLKVIQLSCRYSANLPFVVSSAAAGSQQQFENGG